MKEGGSWLRYRYKEWENMEVEYYNLFGYHKSIVTCLGIIGVQLAWLSQEYNLFGHHKSTTCFCGMLNYFSQKKKRPFSFGTKIPIKKHEKAYFIKRVYSFMKMKPHWIIVILNIYIYIYIKLVQIDFIYYFSYSLAFA